jgi:hypothetical protein
MSQNLSHSPVSDHDAFVESVHHEAFVTGPPQRLRSNFSNGAKRLPVWVAA